MLLGLFAALASAVCYGVATVLQAVAARAAPRTDGVDPRLLLRLLQRAPFLAGILLDALGFAFQILALRRIPVFLAQTALAANLAVTALVGVPVLGVRMSRRDWAAVVSVCLGLAALAVSAGPEGHVALPGGARFALLGLVLLLAGAGFAAGRLSDPGRSAVLGAVAGLGFGVVALAARALTGLRPADLIRDPASYALVGGGLVAFLFFATGLQSGAVTVTIAAVGVVALGDQIRPGFAPVAAAGFVVALAGALSLTRFGEPADHPAQRE
jgi:drug/metabolite transporter (DMT)-like permease